MRSSTVARILEECEQRYILKAVHLIKISSIVQRSLTTFLVVLILICEAYFCAKDDCGFRDLCGIFLMNQEKAPLYNRERPRRRLLLRSRRGPFLGVSEYATAWGLLTLCSLKTVPWYSTYITIKRRHNNDLSCIPLCFSLVVSIYLKREF